jgi:hypothetical protein
VIAWHDEHGDSHFGDLLQGFKRSEYELLRNPTSVEKVSTVYNEVDFSAEGWRKSKSEVIEEIMPSSPTADPGSQREIESEVGISQEENPDVRKLL